MKYTIVIEFELEDPNEFVPTEAMNELTALCEVQLESLDDGTMDILGDRQIHHKITESYWVAKA
jgi:hypothetical protein